MSSMAQTKMGRWLVGAVALAAMPVLMAERVWGRQAAAVSSQQPSATAATPVAAPSAVQSASAASQPGVLLDRLVAVVNSDVILESDVDEERRFEEVQPYRATGISTREQRIARLIDRTLIIQQAALQPEDAVSDKDLDTQMDRLRKDIPACKEYHCETDEGWKRYLGHHGFTDAEFRLRWLQRMQLLKFIQVRFRNGISISDAEIKDYYEKSMLPEYQKRNVTPPPLETIRGRIEEVLLQQQVGALLQDWLTSLRAQGSVRIITPGEVAP